jgi:hypothetical protein
MSHILTIIVDVYAAGLWNLNVAMTGKTSMADEGCHASLQIFVQVMKANSVI